MQNNKNQSQQNKNVAGSQSKEQVMEKPEEKTAAIDNKYEIKRQKLKLNKRGKVVYGSGIEVDVYEPDEIVNELVNDYRKAIERNINSGMTISISVTPYAGKKERKPRKAKEEKEKTL